jgi:hypothetical protein
VLEPLPFDPPGHDRFWYAVYILSPAFWRSFSSTWLLLFEADAVLCPNPTKPLSAWLQTPHVLVGAPWRGRQTPAAYLRHGIDCCNSGLSLWRRDVVLSIGLPAAVSEMGRNVCNGTEWGCNKLFIDDQAVQWLNAANRSSRLPLPPFPAAHEAARFSTESWFPGGFTPFGSHDPLNCFIAHRQFGCFEELLRRCPPVATMFATRNASWPPPQWWTLEGLELDSSADKDVLDAEFSRQLIALAGPL